MNIIWFRHRKLNIVCSGIWLWEGGEVSDGSRFGDSRGGLRNWTRHQVTLVHLVTGGHLAILSLKSFKTVLLSGATNCRGLQRLGSRRRLRGRIFNDQFDRGMIERFRFTSWRGTLTKMTWRFSYSNDQILPGKDSQKIYGHLTPSSWSFHQRWTLALVINTTDLYETNKSLW